MKHVVIVQHRLLHYRVDLFNLIKLNLEKNGIKLHLVHGVASPTEGLRKDEGTLPWAKKIKNRFFSIYGVDLIWQHLPDIANNCELLILMQENRILSNYHHIVKRNLTGKKIGFWGHGKNLQSTKPTGLKEQWKLKWLTSVDWWFAYTQSTVDYLVSQSFESNKTTCLNNAIDIKGFKDQIAAVTDIELKSVCDELGIEDNSTVGIYCGSLYKEKRLELMIDAADLIKSKIDNFYLIIIGDGPDADILHEAAKTRGWLSLVGVKKGQDKALYYRLSKLVLNPGLVGLHVLDAFSAGVPMITTIDALHSPEYDYLEHNVNGLVLSGTVAEYAEGIINLLNDEQLYLAMSARSINDSNKYTVEAMAENFANGIIHCLADKT
jgi:glycosyltransferase involved in cell wall biosynthesis